MGTRALIGLGSNLGDRRAHLDGAIAAMDAVPGTHVRAVSSFVETAPVGGPAGQDAYLNAAAALETTLEPLDLLRQLQEIERRAGRVRTRRWAERPIDLDILLFDGQVLESPGLIVPHPRMAVRRFVLAPLAEVAPGFADPLTGRPIASLLANLDRRPGYVALHGIASDVAKDVILRLVDALPAVEIRAPESLSDSNLNGSQRASDRWLVSAFWLDAEVMATGLFDSDIPRFLEARTRRIAPTFVVTGPGGRRAFARDSPAWPRAARLGDVPILEVESGVAESIAAEAMAACAATRSGL